VQLHFQDWKKHAKEKMKSGDPQDQDRYEACLHVVENDEEVRMRRVIETAAKLFKNDIKAIEIPSTYFPLCLLWTHYIIFQCHFKDFFRISL